MSKRSKSTHNLDKSQDAELVRSDEAVAGDQSEFGWTSGAEQMTNEEREHQRNIHSNALENAGDAALIEERIIPEGMGGAGGGDVDDVGDVGFPEEAGGGAVSAQQREFVDRNTTISEGMGGAGGGDLDDVGDVGYPEGSNPSAESDVDPGSDAADTRIAQASRRASGTGDDVEI